MSSIEGRIEALEQAAKLIAKQTPPILHTVTFEELRSKFEEILARPRPETTVDEQIRNFKADVERMRINWELRRGKQPVRDRNK